MLVTLSNKGHVLDFKIPYKGFILTLFKASFGIQLLVEVLDMI